MSFESFLQFWSVYNRQIIEFVFVFTFVLILFVIYRQFFAKSDSIAGAGGPAPVSIDTSEIEEKLRKILENQGPIRGLSSAEPSTAVAVAAPVVEGVASAPVVDTAELEKLRNEVKERDKAIEDLKKNASAAPAGGDSKKFEDKIKELEGRLQEYEIISEDIADLSFYKEENARLQKEISTAGAGKTAAAPVAPIVAATPPPPVPEPVAATSAPAVESPKLEEIKVAVPETAADPASETLSITKPDIAPASKESEAVVDDDILKEFAAAVEGQKNGEAVAAPAPKAAGTPSTEPQSPVPQAVDPQKLVESKELMGDFENFIKKG